MTDLLPILIPVWLGLVIVAGLIWRARSGKPIVPRVPAGAAFGETGASGRVLGGVLFGTARAGNCLIVFVDRGQLVVTLAFPFSILPGLGALQVEAPVNGIRQIVARRRWRQDVLEVHFADPARKSIELVLQDEAGFVRALGLPAITQDRPLRTSRPSRRWNARFARGFLVLWGTLAISLSGFGLKQDLAVRSSGLAIVAHVTSMQGENPTLAYTVNGTEHSMASRVNTHQRHLGETETLYVDPSDPGNAVESGALEFELIFLVAGTITLVCGLFGKRMIPGWS